jgi:hypothetical protein
VCCNADDLKPMQCPQVITVGPRFKTAMNELLDLLTQCPSLPSILSMATVEVKHSSIAIVHVADGRGYNSTLISRWAFNIACSRCLLIMLVIIATTKGEW